MIDPQTLKEFMLVTEFWGCRACNSAPTGLSGRVDGRGRGMPVMGSAWHWLFRIGGLESAEAAFPLAVGAKLQFKGSIIRTFDLTNEVRGQVEANGRAQERRTRAVMRLLYKKVWE